MAHVQSNIQTTFLKRLETTSVGQGECVLGWDVWGRWKDKGFLKVKAMKQKIILLPEFPCASALCQAAKESLEIKANPCPHKTENLIN